MAVQLKWNGEKFQRMTADAIRVGIQRSSVKYHGDCRRAVNKSNRRGREPSKPGEPPRKGTGFGQSGIAWEFDASIPAARVGIVQNALYMLGHELGTGPHTIRPRHGKVLRIPYLKQGRPTEQEIEKYGWQRGPADGKGNRWFRFVRQVRHPGTKKRAFMIPTLMTNLAEYGRLACTGGPSSLR